MINDASRSGLGRWRPVRRLAVGSGNGAKDRFKFFCSGDRSRRRQKDIPVFWRGSYMWQRMDHRFSIVCLPTLLTSSIRCRTGWNGGLWILEFVDTGCDAFDHISRSAQDLGPCCASITIDLVEDHLSTIRELLTDMTQ